MREAQHLAAVEVIEDAIVLSVMRFADELVDVTQFNFPAAKDVRPAELAMAKSLVNSLAAEWDPAKYTDQYRENLMRIIQAKVKGKKVALEPTAEPRHADVVDLMERLRRSLEQGSGRARAARPSARPAARAKSAKGAPIRGRKKRAA
jgi:DNA end-binding protein Ku